MPYPEKLFNELTQKYPLDDQQKQTLLQTLTVDGMQEILEGNWLDPNSLIKLHERQNKYFILSPVKAQMLVETNQAVKNDQNFQLQKSSFSNVLLWLENGDELYPYVASSKLAKMILERENLIVELTKVAKEDPEKMKQWDNIKVTIQEINSLPGSKKTQRKLLAEETSKSIASLAEFLLKSQLLLAEHLSFSISLHSHMNAQMQLVEEAAKLYFEPLFKKQNKIIDETTFFHKKDGDQLGRRMRIKYRLADDGTQHQIIYHIKTHQHGSTSRGSSTKPVDAKELFIYKVFEYMGFGPKVHFFFNSLSRGGFYIATQDASFSKKPAINKSFKTYQEMVEENKLSSNEETYINLYGSRKLSLVAAIEKAHTEIVAYIQENGTHLGLEISPVLQNLEKYKADVLENFKTLATKIKAYQIEPEASSSSSAPRPSM